MTSYRRAGVEAQLIRGRKATDPETTEMCLNMKQVELA